MVDLPPNFIDYINDIVAMYELTPQGVGWAAAKKVSRELLGHSFLRIDTRTEAIISVGERPEELIHLISAIGERFNAEQINDRLEFEERRWKRRCTAVEFISLKSVLFHGFEDSYWFSYIDTRWRLDR